MLSMDWLVTVKRDVDLKELLRLLHDSGCSRTESAPIPLDEDEQVISVTGPADLPKRLGADRRVVKVSPNSSMTLY